MTEQAHELSQSTAPTVARQPAPAEGAGASPRGTARVLLYSDDSGTRRRVRTAVEGSARFAEAGLAVEFVECATAPAVLERLGRGGVDACVLDGEATPVGGMGLCRQIKDEIFQAPPVLLLVARPQDAWLGAWSNAESVVRFPGDPAVLAGELGGLLERSASLPA
ncbi:hypothetical protein [Allostreptomyces psammosilenae]|uniref:CheY-like chemotaxis protein n=1 Tax=Allostreptomyces psammosilenae TaxID=1892865 RepID=A0A853A929_9ACTN|nr:hypothetical protein [Allostreptomyces psammosilenae]NYI07028.1 CheY-like chemotaxis protein [Allostreptomyces psammosilenae]